MRYRPEIDGLRAVAVVPVILHHAGFTAFSGGYVGVDVFFVISGFLITLLILQDVELKQFSLLSFYERRARRILPALVCVVIGCIPFAWLWLYPSEFKDFGESVVSVALFYSNIHFMAETNYFLPDASLKPLLHTWSLSVEEQFYLIYPVLLVFLLKKSVSLARNALLVISVVSLLLAEIGWRLAPTLNYFLYPTRAWELGIGCIIALNFSGAQKLGEKYSQYLSAIGLLMIASAIVGFDINTPFPSFYALLPVLGSALVILFATEKTVIGRLLSTPFLVGLGLISYSVYLWHQPIFAFAKLRFGTEPGTPIFVSLVLFSLALGYFSWRYVERPFRDRALVSRFTIFSFSIAAMFVLIVAGVSAIVSVQFGILSDKIALDLANRMRPNYGISQICDYRGQYRQMDECQTAPNPTLALWGDSYAMQLFDGLKAALPNRALVQITRSSCGSIAELSAVSSKAYRKRAAECIAFNADALKYISSNREIKDVILASRYDSFVDEKTLLFNSDRFVVSNLSDTLRQLTLTIETLQLAGKSVTVVSSLPRISSDIGRCLSRAMRFNGNKQSCDFEFTRYLAIESDVYKERALLADLVKKNVKVIMLEDYICDKKTCRASNGDILFYRDYGHLSIEGSRWLGQNTSVFDSISKTSY